MKPARIIPSALVLGATILGFTPDTSAAQKRQRDLITREELENSSHRDHDLFRAVRALRPHFLEAPRGNRSMGPGGSTAPTVLYVDESRQGDLGMLKLIPVMTVEEVRYLEPSKAQHEFGHTHSGGAVLVKLRKPLRPSEQPPPAASPGRP